MDIKAVVFDCDDTLLDSMSMWRSVLPEVLSGYAGHEAAQKHQARAETMGADEGLALFVEENGLAVDPASIKAKVMERAHWHYAHDVPTIAGAAEFLEQVRAAGLPMAVASCSELPEVECGLEANGLLGFFDAVYSVSMGYASKSEPDMWLAAARDFCLDPSQVLVVEDSLHAVTVAAAAGFPTLGLTWPSSRHCLEEMEAAANVALPAGWQGVGLQGVLEAL